ncbi:MAG: homoserine dehydrogenase [Kiritimatiellia bacterium]
MKTYGVGILGFGTVGAGVIETLQRNGDLLAARTGLRLEVRKVADLDITRDRGVKVDPSILTKDAMSVIDDPSVNIVVELIGGVKIAREVILKALRAGKPVVTANKALLAEHGDELYAVADENNADLYYEASVCGGIPVIRSLREGLIANHIESMFGIMNGTCNYILTRMEQENLPFDKVLADAQAKGYAEAEPSLDIDGIDTAHKAAILASLAYGFPVPMSSVHVEGIRGLDPLDIHYAKELGYRIKLLAQIRHDSGGIEVRVCPTLVPLNHMLASVSGVFNALLVRGDIVGDTLYYGRGAGRLPTASAVVSDLADVARNLSLESELRVPALVRHGEYGDMKKRDELQSSYYLRMSLKDHPRVLAQVAQVLGDHEISIASVIQNKPCGGSPFAPVIIVTHRASEKKFREALQKIDALDVVGAKTVRMAIEDFE